MIDKQLLLQGCKQFEIELSTQAAEQLDTYAQLLVEWNGKMNLTAITDPQGIVFKHFVDSLLLLKAVELPQGSSLIDVGAGAGFPSMPVKIARPDLAVTMLDSLQKRLTFLEEVSRQLELDCTFIHARAEDGGREKKLRERFDFATARAVAHLRELAEYCLPFVKKGGVFLAMKGWEVEEEAEGASRAIQLLGGRISTVEKLRLPLDCGRALVKVEKISQTPAKFPRIPAKIAKNPLI